MSSYNKIRFQFNQFVRTLKAEELTEHEKKLINLILENFDSIAAVGTASGKRVNMINELIDKNRTTISAELKNTYETSIDNDDKIISLNSLEVENFRGFANKEIFDLNKSKVLVYGPNGSGKTSFCEALEFSLLGYLSEAGSKRIEVTHYVTNVHTKKFSRPIITGINSSQKTLNLNSNVDKYYFCFIEKNRIIDFARYSSKTQGQQENLLATLFGLDDFYSFVNNFTDNISGKIPIESLKQISLDRKTVEISGHKQNIENSTSVILALEKDKKTISTESKLNKTFEEIDLYINGNDETLGRIKVIDNELQKPKGKSFNHSKVNELFSELAKIEKLLADYESNNSKFEQEKGKINFRAIFELVNNLENVITDKCPVCETPIEQTKINPYTNAKAKLKELEGIALIEDKLNSSWSDLLSETYIFTTEFQIRKESSQELEIELRFNISELLLRFQIEKSEIKKYIEELKSLIANIKSDKQTLINLEQKTSKVNELANKHADNIKSLQTEKDELQIIKKQVDDLKAKLKSHEEIITNGKKAIKEFDDNNKELIEEIAKEKIIIEENKKYVESYSSFLQKLKSYKRELPTSLVTNLNSLTKDFYNFINKDDNKFELIERIDLPANAGDRVKIWFQDNPEIELDAMHMLSEGHTRCLGLSILLAKVVELELPFIIFDDIVNAIDHDHRGRIRELLFDNSLINEKQVIITSHSEEYIKDIENKHFTKLGYDDERILYVFLKPISKTIRKKETTKHYLNKATLHFNEHSYRDSLMECRRALENLSNDLWLRASKKYVFQITYKVRAPLLPPDLMGIVNSLKKELTNLKVSDFETSLSVLSWLAGLETKNNQIWNYLNKGTHEESERDDFDPIIVEEVITNLIALETELLATKK